MGKEITIQLYQDKQRKYRYRIKTKDGNILAISSEGYKAERNCLYTLGMLINNLALTNYNFQDLTEYDLDIIEDKLSVILFTKEKKD